MVSYQGQITQGEIL